MALKNLIKKFREERTKLDKIIESLEQLERSTMKPNRKRVKAKLK
jgi:hypothetical protein